jgi:hypothetical protein
MIHVWLAGGKACDKKTLKMQQFRGLSSGMLQIPQLLGKNCLPRQNQTGCGSGFMYHIDRKHRYFVSGKNRRYYMAEISKEYVLLFNAITETEQALRQLQERLMFVQRQAEELYLQAEEEVCEEKLRIS